MPCKLCGDDRHGEGGGWNTCPFEKPKDPWDNLKVDDVIKTQLGTVFVQAVVGNLVALRKAASRKIFWELKRTLKEDGCIIKSSFPEEEKKCTKIELHSCNNNGCNCTYGTKCCQKTEIYVKTERSAEEKLESIKN